MPVREYYHFNKRQCTRVEGPGGTKTRYTCPACGKAMTEIYLADHECDGGTDQYPKLDIMKYKVNHRWKPTSAFKPVGFKPDAVKPK